MTPSWNDCDKNWSNAAWFKVLGWIRIFPPLGFKYSFNFRTFASVQNEVRATNFAKIFVVNIFFNFLVSTCFPWEVLLLLWTKYSLYTRVTSFGTRLNFFAAHAHEQKELVKEKFSVCIASYNRLHCKQILSRIHSKYWVNECTHSDS
jgi:hypothetical protein